MWKQEDASKAYGILPQEDQAASQLPDLKYLKPNAFFPATVIMIRPAYEVALNTLEENFAEPTGGTLIEGQSGVGEPLLALTSSHMYMVVRTRNAGKTSFLYYILCERLRAGKPTALQRDQNGFYLFDSRGVHLMDPSCESGAMLRHGATEDTWALVDANEQVKMPAKAFRGFSPFFVVEAVSSWSDKRANWMKYKTLDIVDYFMEPWSPEEIRRR